MAFCGQCGLHLNTNTTRCPRCGTQTDFDAATPGTSADENSATVITHTNNSQPGRVSYTPLPKSSEIPSPDAREAVNYPAPGGNAYPGQRPSQPGNQQDGNSYPIPGTFNAGLPSDGNNYMAPGAPPPNVMPQANNPVPAQQIFLPGPFPTTDPGYPFQPPIPSRKTNQGLVIIIVMLLVALLAVTGLFFALGSNQLAGLFGAKNPPIAQATLTTQPAPTAPQNTASTQSSPTATQQTTPTTAPTQQAQATIQQYYADINKQDFQDAYNLWVSYPDTYNNFKQGFVYTHHDAITLGDAVTQTDGTVQVSLTLQATADAASGGTQVTTYQGYYTVGQQADGSWKIINGQLA